MQVWLFYIGGKKKLSLIPYDLNYFQTHFIGKPMKCNWQPPPVKIHGKNLRLKDFVGGMFQAPVCSERAKKRLESVIGSYIEFLTLIEIKGKCYYAINVLKTVDCLDVSRSEIVYFDHDPGRIMDIYGYTFLPDRIEDVPIFKVPERQGSKIFVTQKFVDVIVANKLTGASFADPSINCWDYVFGKSVANIVPGVFD